MKKLGYEIENKDYINALVIGIIIFCIFILGAFYLWNNIFLTIIIIATLTLFIFIFASISSYKEYKNNIKKINYIRNNGKKIEGVIQGYKQKEKRQINRYDYTTIYSLFIMYIDPSTGKPVIIETPSLNFNPKFDLGSIKCTIYLYKNDFYATDFVKSKKGKAINIKKVDNLFISQK